MKKVLVADDEVIKYMAIKKALEFNGIHDIQLVGNQEAVWEEIEKEYPPRDIPFLLLSLQLTFNYSKI